MPPKGWKVVSIREEVFNRLKVRYQREVKDLKYKPEFTAWLNQLLLEQLEKPMK